MKTITTPNFIISMGLALCFLGGPLEKSHGQISRDLRNIFQAMLDDLDEDLRLKFEEALETDSSVIKMTREQFRRIPAKSCEPFRGPEIGGG